MIRWPTLLLASFLAPLSSQVARFVRLPAEYFVTSSDIPTATLSASSLKQCSVQATIQELAALNVTHYSFYESSDGSCKIYTSFDYIGKVDATVPEKSSIWFMKVPDNVTYGGSCDKQDIDGLAEYLNTTRSESGFTSAPASTTRTTPRTTKRATPRTTPRTTPKPNPCKATNPRAQAGIYLDYSGMTVTPYSGEMKIAVDCVCNSNPKLKQQFWKGAASRTSWEASFQVRCTNMVALCIVPEQGNPWVPKGVPPEEIYLFPYCEAIHGCHTYVLHTTSRFYNKMVDLYTGYLGAVLQSGGTQFNEARYYDPKLPSGSPNQVISINLKPRGFTSTAYIKAAAISCGGCKTVQKYASFTCTMPSAKG